MKLLFIIMVHFKNKKWEHTVRTTTCATLFRISPKIVIWFLNNDNKTKYNILKRKLCTLQIMAGTLLKKTFSVKTEWRNIHFQVTCHLVPLHLMTILEVNSRHRLYGLRLTFNFPHLPSNIIKQYKHDTELWITG